MVKVTEVKGSPHVLVLADKSTVRILPYETKSIKDSLVSEDIRNAESLGFIVTQSEVAKISLKESKKIKEV